MKYKNLHTHALEQLYGPISLNILKQDETIRIVELRDGKGMSRTLAIVKFLDIHGDALKKAHNKVINGGLLGKTLLDFKIDFDKEYMGSVEVKLPKWLKNDFNTDKDFTVGFMSNIWINDTSGKKSRFLFSEIVEIIPPELKNDFAHKIKPLQNKALNVMSLFDEAKIEMI